LISVCTVFAMQTPPLDAFREASCANAVVPSATVVPRARAAIVRVFPSIGRIAITSRTGS
jgi:hypothetical protein